MVNALALSPGASRLTDSRNRSSYFGSGRGAWGPLHSGTAGLRLRSVHQLRHRRLTVLSGSVAAALADPVFEPAARSYDFLVLGSGIAGLSYALKVAQYGSVAIVSILATLSSFTCIRPRLPKGFAIQHLRPAALLLVLKLAQAARWEESQTQEAGDTKASEFVQYS